METMCDLPKVKFAVGREVSGGQLFKSSFARSFIGNEVRDSKSLDYGLLNGTIIEENECNGNVRNNNSHGNNNHFYSLINLSSENNPKFSTKDEKKPIMSKTNEITQKPIPSATEVAKLRKQCQTLKEENKRLQSALSLKQLSQIRTLDKLFLQTQINTLQWQLKQTDSNRQMYRSLMEEVARFLERAHKSLIILHEKRNSKEKSSVGRVPRSRSVHAVHAESSPCRGASTSSTATMSSTFFTRAKSVTQISPSNGNGSATPGTFRDFTWSVLRRNDSMHYSTPQSKPAMATEDIGKVEKSVAYSEPKQLELDPDEIPPEKLSQEAFRLMRTVQSLLAMREPDLARVSPDNVNNVSSSLHYENLVETSFTSTSTLVQKTEGYAHCSIASGLDGANETMDSAKEEAADTNDRPNLTISSSEADNSFERSLLNALSNAKRSLDMVSFDSESSKTTNEEMDETLFYTLSSASSSSLASPPASLASLSGTSATVVQSPGSSRESSSTATTTSATTVMTERENHRDKMSTSTPNKGAKKMERPREVGRPVKPKSTDDESGFSSLSSFQEVGLPQNLAISPIKGCHTEVGLPEIPLQKIAVHRRWSSTPAEIQALLKRHRASFPSSRNAESMSVWV